MGKEHDDALRKMQQREQEILREREKKWDEVMNSDKPLYTGGILAYINSKDNGSEEEKTGE